MGSTLQPLAQLQTLLGAMVWLLAMPKVATDAGCGNARLAIPRLDIPIAWVVCWATDKAAQHSAQNTLASVRVATKRSLRTSHTPLASVRGDTKRSHRMSHTLSTTSHAFPVVALIRPFICKLKNGICLLPCMIFHPTSITL